MKDHEEVQKVKSLSFDEVMDSEKSAFTINKEASTEKLKESIQSLANQKAKKSS